MPLGRKHTTEQIMAKPTRVQRSRYSRITGERARRAVRDRSRLPHWLLSSQVEYVWEHWTSKSWPRIVTPKRSFREAIERDKSP